MASAATAPLLGLSVVAVGGALPRLAAACLADLGAAVRIDGDLSADAAAPVAAGRAAADLAHRVRLGTAVVRRESLVDLLFTDDAGAPLTTPTTAWTARVLVRFALRDVASRSDLTLQAASGMLLANGSPHRRPPSAPGSQAFQAVALRAAIDGLAALFRPSNDSPTATVVVDPAAAIVDYLAEFTSSGQRRPLARRGQLHPSRDFMVLDCADGAVTASLRGDWTTLGAWIATADGWPPVRDRPLGDSQARSLFAAIARFATTQTRDELSEQAQIRRLPFAGVRDFDELLDDPQLAARGFFRKVAGPDGSVVRVASPPFRFMVADGEPATSSAAAAAPTGPPLAGVRVLDFTWHVAGPVATRVLADLGADVIKVEHPEDNGDDRATGLFAALNGGKRSVAIDLRTADGRTIARRLAGACDIVVDNFSERVLRNLGLDGATLRQRDPRLITITISGFGAGGPRRDWVAFAPTLHALSGFTAAMRDEDGSPVGWGWSFSDFAAGQRAALAILAAHGRRQRTGRGMQIEFSQFENLVALLAPELAALDAGGAWQEARWHHEAEAAPHGIYTCQSGDGGAAWIALAIGGDSEWRRFVAIAGTPPWAMSAAFASHAARCRQRGALDIAVENWARTQCADDLLRRLRAADLAAAHVCDPTTLAAPDRPAAPQRSQHAAAVLAELLGLDEVEITALRQRGIVR